MRGITRAAAFLAELAEVSRTFVDAHAFRCWTLNRLAKQLPYDSAIFVVRPGLTGRPASVNKEEFLHLHGLFARDQARLGPGLERGQGVMRREGAYLDTDVYSSRERANLPFYAEMIRPQRITNQMVGDVRFRDRQLGIIYICRNGRVAPFRHRELDAFKRLLPAIQLTNAALDAIPPRLLDGRQLTPREVEVALLVTRGLRNHEIAAQHGTSAHTVRNQLHQIFEKLGISNRAELAGWIAGAAERDV